MPTALHLGQWLAAGIAIVAIIAGSIHGEAVAAIITTLTALSGVLIVSKIIERWPKTTEHHPDSDDHGHPDSTGEPT
jgi:hypothetical protein